MELSDYLALRYTRILTQDDDGQFIATIPELQGCTADGATEIEALDNLRQIQTLWLQAALDARDTIPLPTRPEELPSGKWVQRVPKWLHARLVTAAAEEETSLNQLVISLLSEGLALRNAWRNPPAKMVKAAIKHAWAKQEEQRAGRYAYAPETQTDTTAVEALRRSGDTAAATLFEQYRDRKKK